MTPYRIAVVDDLERDRAWLAEKLADYMARERLEYELTAFASGEAFSAALEQGQRFNLVFMDIYMDGITGIEAAQALRARDMDCKLVFLTTSEDFMRQGFSLNSAHYLIKPVKDEDFAQAMANCRLGRALKYPPLPLRWRGERWRWTPVRSGIWRYSSAAWCCTPPGRPAPGPQLFRRGRPAGAGPAVSPVFQGSVGEHGPHRRPDGDELRLDDGSILPIAPGAGGDPGPIPGLYVWKNEGTVMRKRNRGGSAVGAAPDPGRRLACLCRRT
ncbi:response regulator [Flavonifractor plautii]|nr:response regulator [Flavonifractor plautii]